MTDSASPYYQAVSASDAALEQRQRQISAAEDAGRITTREAADARVAALTNHLAACSEARERYLGGLA
jgi:hypothetical protein